MGFEDGSFGDVDWGQLYNNPGDPLAGSQWEDVMGQAPQVAYQPDFEIPPTGDASNIFGDGVGDPSQSAIQRLLQKLAPKPGQNNLADLSSMLGAYSSGQKANRVVQGNFTQGYDRLMLDAQKDRNSNESDSLKKLAQTSYILDGGSKFKPPAISVGGKDYAPLDLGFGPRPSSDAQKAGAAALQPQLQGRLAPGGSYMPQPLDDYAKPGLGEQIGSNAAVGVGAAGSLADLLSGITDSAGGTNNPYGASGTPGFAVGGQTPGSGVSSTASDLMKGIGTAGSVAGMASKTGFLGSGAGSTMGSLLGKAVPIAGGAMGAYGVANNQSVGSDTLAGAGAGASIGSFGGPVGTAVGAGIGALVGALRGAFSVTKKEQGGRDAQVQVTNNLKSLSSPQQQAEAAKAGWPDPNQALSLIVMRDALTKKGIPPQQAEAQAEQYMHSIWDAEQSGAQDVMGAARPISSLMRG